MAISVMHGYLMQAAYFAPRGKKRLLLLGSNIGQRYLSPEDKLIGLIGEAGSGKSLLIRGMFPGLELTNDDDGINIRPLPLLADAQREHFRYRTYHIDARFETAFTQTWMLAEAVRKAIDHGRRVVIEHFDQLYPALEINAEVLIGVGEEVIVTRPGIFGPYPKDIAAIVFESIKYRRMAHTAEDITGLVLEELGIKKPQAHSDIKHGFILEFSEKPDLDFDFVEKRVLEYIAQDLIINHYDENHIKIGERVCQCTGPRIHLRRTGEIEGFHLIKEFKWDPIDKLYVLAGLVGTGS
ncbi:MAG: alanine-tRNA synthetase second additional domain-containing protein [Clostridia bacterium]|nr:alanine-tRNA synthetase second additional domain-containing protein [Clostridia bacterium]